MLISIAHYLSFSIWGVAICLSIFGTIVALFHLKKDTRKSQINFVPENDSSLDALTILKPLKGVDDGIKENIESFFRVDYPCFEILFSVADPHDPVIPIVQRLMTQYQDVSSKLFIGDTQSGPNPKINNMLRSYESARYDWILISDSNTRVAPDHLKNLARQFKDGIAMQSSVVAGVAAKGLGGLLESAFLNTFYVRSSLALNAVGHPCVLGKAMLFRKSILERTGGMKSLKRHIAEDYAAGRKLHLLGFRVQVSAHPIRQHIGNYSFKDFWSRHIRWGRLIKVQNPFGFAAEPLLNSMFSGFLGAYAFHALFGWSPFVFFALHLGLWLSSDFILSTRMAGRPKFHFAPIWLLRELTHLPMWIHTAFGSSINWRGKVIHLKKPRLNLKRVYDFEDLNDFMREPA